MPLSKRRPSHLNLNKTIDNEQQVKLSPRTPKSITKPRRCSILVENKPSLLSDKINETADVHTLYKIKKSSSLKKLDQFFGEFTPQDICIKEVKKEGLKAMLESKIPLCYFMYHLLEEYSSENLFFFIELEQYDSFNYLNTNQQLATAQHIVNIYLTRNSYFEVNLDDNVVATVKAAIESRDLKNCFQSAKRAIYSLLETSYMRFQTSETYDLMVKNCGELNTFYDEKLKVLAVNQLLLYITKEESKLEESVDNFHSIKTKRYELIKSMIHEFCRTFIGVEFYK